MQDDVVRHMLRRIVTFAIAVALSVAVARGPQPPGAGVFPDGATIEHAKLVVAQQSLKVGLFRSWAVGTVLRHRIEPTSTKSLVWWKTGGE